MRMQRIVFTCALSIAATGAAWAEEYRGTWQQQMACTPDVWRLCSDQVPDVNRIVSCLRQNTTQLSSNCRAVFESNAAASPSDAARAAPPPPPHGRSALPPQPQAVPPQPQQLPSRPYVIDDD